MLYNHVHVLAFDMYVGIGCVYDYECDSASKEAYMYVSTCMDNRIGDDKLQCNHVQSYPGYPYPGYPKPRLSETSIIRTEFRTWSLFKKVVFLIKIAVSATEQSTDVCVSYVHVQCTHTVVRHRVQCEL